MKFSIHSKTLEQLKCDLAVVSVFEDQKTLDPNAKRLDQLTDGQISQVTKSKDFSGKSKETLMLFPKNGAPVPRILLVGLGKKSNYDLEAVRLSISQTTGYIKKHKVKTLSLLLAKNTPKKSTVKESVQAIVETLALSGYQFNEYKKQNGQTAVPEEVIFVPDNQKHKQQVLQAANLGQTIAEAVKLTRDLGNHPGNVATPSHLAEHAKQMARESKQIKVRVLGQKEIEKEKMGGLLAVAQGTIQEPKFIVLEYLPKKTGKKTVLVGKGITFDSGGISIKPSERMEEMKYDMAGAATVMGIIKAAADLKLPVNLVGLVAATENLPGGRSMKPGDIATMRSGKTVEIVNTDAEGRLILADTLDYAKQYKPDLVIDFATLTGAIVVSLGDEIIGSFTNKDANNKLLKQAEQNTGEKLWPMPLEKEYNQFMKSEFADLRNIGTIRYGDAINAALFLQNFVDFPWIHLDIAGVAWATREKPYRPKGATGTGVRLILDFLKSKK